MHDPHRVLRPRIAVHCIEADVVERLVIAAVIQRCEAPLIIICRRHAGCAKQNQRCSQTGAKTS